MNLLLRPRMSPHPVTWPRAEILRRRPTPTVEGMSDDDDEIVALIIAIDDGR